MRRRYTAEPLWRGSVSNYTDHSAENLATIIAAGPMAEFRVMEPHLEINELANYFTCDLFNYDGWEGVRAMLPIDTTELTVATLSASRILKKNRKAFNWTVAELIVNEYVDLDDIAERLEPAPKPKRKHTTAPNRRCK